MSKCCNKEMLISNSPYTADGRAKKRDEIGKPWCSVCGEYGGKADTIGFNPKPLLDALCESDEKLIWRIRARYGDATQVGGVAGYNHTPQEYLSMARRLFPASYTVDAVELIGNSKLKVTYTWAHAYESTFHAADIEAGHLSPLDTIIFA